MKAYIDKSALIAEIERKMNLCKKILLRSRTQQDKEYHQGNIEAYEVVTSLLDTLEVKEVDEESTSNDLEEAASQYPSIICRISPQWKSEVENVFKAGAQWQKEQMEKNRIEHCDNITEEQYNLETGFLDDFLDKNKRMPTFLDAIEYGMKKAQKGE